MSYETDAAAVGRAADERIAGLVTENARLNDHLSAFQAEVDSLEDQIAALEEELAKYRPNQYRKFLGINGHSTFNNDPTYGNDAKVLATFKHLGATRARDILVLNQDQSSYFQTCADMGIKLCLTIGTFDKFADSQKAGYVAAMKKYADKIEAVAGFNEPDNGRERSVWLPKVVAQQKWLYQAVKSDPALEHIKVLPGAIMNVNPNLAADLKALYAAIDGYYDFPNAHIYPSETPDVDKYIAARFALFPSAPWVTEGGASTVRVSDEIQTRNCVALLKACTAAGTPLFVYEAVDNYPKGQTTDPEHYMGIYDSNYQPKMAATALRALCGVK